MLATKKLEEKNVAKPETIILIAIQKPPILLRIGKNYVIVLELTVLNGLSFSYSSSKIFSSITPSS